MNRICAENGSFLIEVKNVKVRGAPEKKIAWFAGFTPALEEERSVCKPNRLARM
jgi:hypothetical protein